MCPKRASHTARTMRMSPTDASTFWYWFRYDRFDDTWCSDVDELGSPLLAVNCGIAIHATQTPRCTEQARRHNTQAKQVLTLPHAAGPRKRPGHDNSDTPTYIDGDHEGDLPARCDEVGHGRDALDARGGDVQGSRGLATLRDATQR